jgi:NAD(P)-dependent dehydrogenase (short-subunit alcohol dehydrogenase family)
VFDGKVVLVTGAAKGIGRGVVEGFRAAGAKVAIADIDTDTAQALAGQLSGDSAAALAVTGDVSIADDARTMVEATIDAFGRLDVLVNNAGIQPPDWYFPIHQMPEEIWDRIVGVNLKGTFLMSKYALPALMKCGNGVIVNMASVQGLQSMPKVGAYAASKAGILSLTRNMALDYARLGVRVVAICPGTIDSEMVRAAARAEGGNEESNVRRYGTRHPLGRIGTPNDIANAILFLASDQASFITGEYLCIDGGMMAEGAWASTVGDDER